MSELALILLPDTVVSLVVAGDGFEADGLPWTVPAYAGWNRDGYALLELERAGDPPEGKDFVGDAVYQVSGGKCFEVFALEDKPPPSIEELNANLTGRARELEAAGIVVDGMRVATDRESLALINGAHALVQAEPARVIDFDAIDGPVHLNAAQVRTLALAVAGHVQAIFSARCAVRRLIADGSLSTFEQVGAALVASLQPGDQP